MTDGPNRGPVSVTLFGWVACDHGYLVQVLRLFGGCMGGRVGGVGGLLKTCVMVVIRRMLFPLIL